MNGENPSANSSYPTGENNQKGKKINGLIGKTLANLQKEYLVIDKTHIRGWQVWLAIGLVAGIFAGVILVANRSGGMKPADAGSVLPIPKNAFCFFSDYSNDRHCQSYYSGGRPICPKYFNPVFDSYGIFYPSACWAEAMGVHKYTYGYSPYLRKVFRERWAKEGFTVPVPNIEFTYDGSGLVGSRGTWLRSSLWLNNETFALQDYFIATEMGNNLFAPRMMWNLAYPVTGSKPRVLVAYVEFDVVYPPSLLNDFTSTYGGLMNDYVRKKQRVPSPIQYSFSSTVIPPPPGVLPITSEHVYFSPAEIQAIYDTAIQKVGGQSFNAFVIVPVIIDGFGGYYTTWNNMGLVVASLNPPAKYSSSTLKDGLDAVAAFQSMFITLSHEVLHALGLPGDHMPMGYGTSFLDWSAPSIDPVTGKPIPVSISPCDFLGSSPDYYSVELPPEFTVKVGAEPSGLSRMASASGDCAGPLFDNHLLKDFDRDGEYEIMHKNNLIGKELQRYLGWEDVDGDGIAELIDPTPYGMGTAGNH